MRWLSENFLLERAKISAVAGSQLRPSKFSRMRLILLLRPPPQEQPIPASEVQESSPVKTQEPEQLDTLTHAGQAPITDSPISPVASKSSLVAPAHVTDWMNTPIPRLLATRDVQTLLSAVFLPELAAFTMEYDADIVPVSETHLAPDIKFLIPSYTCYRQDRVRTTRRAASSSTAILVHRRILISTCYI